MFTNTSFYFVNTTINYLSSLCEAFLNAVLLLVDLFICTNEINLFSFEFFILK